MDDNKLARDRILAVAAEVAPQGVRLYVGHNLRHYSMIQKMKALIDDGAVGEVKAVWCRHFVGLGYAARGNRQFCFRAGGGGHGGADHKLMAEFV